MVLSLHLTLWGSPISSSPSCAALPPHPTCWCATCHLTTNHPCPPPQVAISVPRSPKRVQLKFEQGRIATPQLLADIDLPASLSVMGQTVDLGQVRSLLQPAAEQVKGIIEQVGGWLGWAVHS